MIANIEIIKDKYFNIPNTETQLYEDTGYLDIFLVEFEDTADLFHFIGLSRYLEEIFNTKVDVISKPSLKEELKQQILEEVIYE